MKSTCINILLATLLIGCKADRPNVDPCIDSRLGYYVEEALENIAKAGGKLKSEPVRVEMVERWAHPAYNGVIAIAYGMNIDGAVHIKVSEEAWNRLTHNQKRWVMIHEMLHDMFNVKHGATLFLHPSVDNTHDDPHKYRRAMKDLKNMFNRYPNGFKPE